MLNEEREREEEREVLGERGEEGRGSGFRCVSTLKKKKKKFTQGQARTPTALRLSAVFSKGSKQANRKD